MGNSEKKSEKEKNEGRNIHDAFFLKTMKVKENAIDFLKVALPAKILKYLDLKKIEYEDTSYIKKTLSKYFSDLVIKTEIEGKKAYLYFLLEHKSSPTSTKKSCFTNYYIIVF